jgi:hypothetical protein
VIPNLILLPITGSGAHCTGICYYSLTHILFSNLFAIDYLKDNPDTTPAEFKLIYDGLAADVKKVCYLRAKSGDGLTSASLKRFTELSKRKKAEAAAPKNASTSRIATTT